MLEYVCWNVGKVGLCGEVEIKALGMNRKEVLGLSLERL